MGRVEESIVIQAPIERVFSVITDYEAYPEFLPDMQAVHVLMRHDDVVVARFELELMMRFDYTVRLQEEPPHGVTWSLQEAKALLRNDGGWRLEAAEGGATRAVYWVDVELRGLIPKSVRERLLGRTLPQTLERFKKRAEAVGRG